MYINGDYNYIKMKNLKQALGKDEENEKMPSSSVSHSFKSMKNDASSSVLSILPEDDDENPCNSIDSHKFTEQLISTFEQFQNSGKAVSEATLQQLTILCGHYIGREGTEKDMLSMMDRMASRALEKAPQELENYIRKFIELIKAQKWKLKSKDAAIKKKTMEFDEIADKMFKKTTEVKKQHKKRFAQVNSEKQIKYKKRSAAKGSKNHDSNGTKNSGDSQDSAQGKLGKLLVCEKFQKKPSGNEKIEDNQTEEHISFSSMISTTVKQRPSRQSKGDKKTDMTGNKKNEKTKETDSKPTDEAFIFYRPKKGKR